MSPNILSQIQGLEDLGGRLEKDGYAILQGTDFLAGILEAAITRGLEFFQTPEPERWRGFSPTLLAGYRGIGTEYSQHPDRPDLMEAISLSSQDVREARWAHPANQGSFEASFAATARALGQIATKVLAALRSHYGLSAQGSRLRCDRHSFLQLSYYQPAKQGERMLQEEHEDGNLFTLVHARQPGLEIRRKDGRFEPVVLSAGDLMIMPSDILSLLTGHRIETLFHRVRSYPEIDVRVSVMYFVNPNPVPGRALRPWVLNASNEGIDIMARTIENPLRFGLPALG
jgi:isopenicillin N synthase-like dioxygenase